MYKASLQVSHEKRKKVCGETVKKISYKNTFILRKLDPQINMPCIVSRA